MTERNSSEVQLCNQQSPTEYFACHLHITHIHLLHILMRILKCGKQLFCNINCLFHTMIIEETFQCRFVNVDFGGVIFL